MNYRHAFHAGNHADVLKHLALTLCIARLKHKDSPFALLDTHAGRGLYDLESEEARRSPEWRDGVAKLLDWPDAPAPVRLYLETLGETRALYPGSPVLAARLMRAQDRLICSELHPEEFEQLKRLGLGGPKTELHHRDGYEAMGALLPFAERRGLVLIDPPYEQTDELARAAAALKAAFKRFGHGVYLWWRPLKQPAELDRYDGELGRGLLRADLWVDAPAREGKLAGSSLAIVNPPFGLEEALREALPALAERLSLGASGWRVEQRG